MKDFSRRAYLIGQSPFEIRLVYTFFLILVLCGFGTIAGYEFSRIGFDATSISTHYLGNGDMAFPKVPAEILETAHFHSFIMALIFITMAHLFLATTPSRGFRLGIIILTFAATVADLAAPALIRFCSPGFIYLLIPAWIGEWIGYVTMALVPIYDMWINPPVREKS